MFPYLQKTNLLFPYIYIYQPKTTRKFNKHLEGLIGIVEFKLIPAAYTVVVRNRGPLNFWKLYLYESLVEYTKSLYTYKYIYFWHINLTNSYSKYLYNRIGLFSECFECVFCCRTIVHTIFAVIAKYIYNLKLSSIQYSFAMVFCCVQTLRIHLMFDYINKSTNSLHLLM